MNEERIINLEIKFAHQDELLTQLNQIVTSQQNIIQRLDKGLLELKRSLGVANSVDGNRSLSDDKPPHY